MMKFTVETAADGTTYDAVELPIMGLKTNGSKMNAAIAVEERMDSTLDLIESQARSLLSNLERVLEQVEKARAGEPFSINRLGVAQSSASILDAYCGTLGGLMDMAPVIRRIALEDETTSDLRG